MLRPRALSPDAVDALVAGGFDAPPDPAFSRACGRATGGNPLLLGELVRELASEGVAPTAAAAASVVEFGAEGIARTVRRRLSALREDAVRVAECVAIVGDGEPVALVAAVARLDYETVRNACSELIAIEVFARSERPGFVHPLVRAAVQRAIARPLLVALHDRAARFLAAADGVAAERVAVHLLHADPAGDAWVVQTLLDAAQDAARRGAPGIAARFAERALAEPPPTTPLRAAVLRVLGTAEATLLAGDYEGHLLEASGLTDDPVAAGECALTLARAWLALWHPRAAIDVLERFLATAPEGSDIAVRLEADLYAFGLSAVGLRPRVAALTTRRLAQLDAGERLDPRIAGPLAGLLIDRPPTRRATELAREAVTHPVFRADAESAGWNQAFHALLAGGAYTDAADLARAILADARRRGAGPWVGWALIAVAAPLRHLGNVSEAEAAVVSGLESFPSWQHDQERRVLAAFVAGPVLLARGALSLVDEMTSDIPAAAGSRHHMYAWAVEARAGLRLAQGRLSDAIADLRDASAAFTPGEFPSPHQSSWRPPLALALAAAGEREEAHEVAAEALADARRFEVPVHIGTALSVSGSIAGGRAGEAQLREAVSILEQTEGRLEHTRAIIRLGVAVGGEEGRALLRAGLDRAARSGATPLADEAHQALIAAGGRPRRDRRFLTGPESLTPGEFRVARLVADGLTNREVAQQLFVTQAAVQFHLRSVFRKLDITARTQLPAALAGEAGTAVAKP
ncbi:hypothetical protein DSM112329_03657 [Paraconexibacter sp. AEG42_29]|uniref:HTH luxR-type domain-containing protein n=1 Tax=Paraconexibacter sp. AEG42_29 TaxID=2997339 RepID=A0AAU7AYQ0_9ACTN